MHRFTKSKRLLTKQEFDLVFTQAKRITTTEFTVLYRKNDKGFARLGMAISKKQVAKAHERNHIKRLLRETFRLKKNMPGVDIVVLARSNISWINHSIIATKLSNAWNHFLIE